MRLRRAMAGEQAAGIKQWPARKRPKRAAPRSRREVIATEASKILGEDQRDDAKAVV